MSVPTEEMTCRELVDLITAYLDGSLPGADVERFNQHLDECPFCRTWLHQMRRTIQLVGQLNEDSLDPRARDDLLARFRDWKRGPRRERDGSLEL